MQRRAFLRAAGRMAVAVGAPMPQATRAIAGHPGNPAEIALFLCGDVMTGRGIDRILRAPR